MGESEAIKREDEKKGGETMNENFYNNHNYDDILYLPHHVSTSRPHMPKIDRAAQFAPFSALSGFSEVIGETGRLTQERVELGEQAKSELNEKLRMIQERIAVRPEVTVTYFQPDKRKSGGAYITATGRVKKIDIYRRTVVMQDGTQIPMEEIIRLKSDAV